uniref:Sm domain-containing protein n=1 Tax=Panagrellus redivivus TaxID=6233 RepID=A0A7E4V1K6_PANRE
MQTEDPALNAVEEPMDFIRLSLNEAVVIKMRYDTIIRGTLQAFDTHMNLIVSDVIEERPFKEIDAESGEEIHSTKVREIPCLFIRGDSVVLVSIPNRVIT